MIKWYLSNVFVPFTQIYYFPLKWKLVKQNPSKLRIIFLKCMYTATICTRIIEQFFHIKVQRRATSIILLDLEYNERLEMLCILSLAKFLHALSLRHFSKIVSDSSHPLFSCTCISFNSRMFSRNNTIYKPGQCQIFFPFFHVWTQPLIFY